MLCEQIRRVDFTFDLAQFYWVVFHSLLKPEGSGVDVAQLAAAAPAANADGGGGVRPHY